MPFLFASETRFQTETSFGRSRYGSYVQVALRKEMPECSPNRAVLNSWMLPMGKK